MMSRSGVLDESRLSIGVLENRKTGTPGRCDPDTGTPRHQDTGTPGHWDTETPGRQDTETPGH